MGALRSSIRRGLAVIGLAPAAAVTAVRAQADKEIGKARADTLSWKAKADQLNEMARQAEQLSTRLAKAQRQAERAELYRTELQEARARVERAEKAVAFSREQLMATEMKLDLVEAAISILDRRTRTSE
jgi:hypothetical protein